MKTNDGTLTCALCGAVLDVREAARVRTMIAAKSGEFNVRVIFVRGEEIHRCTPSGDDPRGLFGDAVLAFVVTNDPGCPPTPDWSYSRPM